MIIYNITFFVEQERYDALLEWLRSGTVATLTEAGSAARSPKLQTVVEVPGDAEFSMQARSVALQVELPDMEAAHRWSESRLDPFLTAYRREMGGESLFFTSILESLPL